VLTDAPLAALEAMQTASLDSAPLGVHTAGWRLDWAHLNERSTLPHDTTPRVAYKSLSGLSILVWIISKHGKCIKSYNSNDACSHAWSRENSLADNTTPFP
jgi:hypothetical protein